MYLPRQRHPRLALQSCWRVFEYKKKSKPWFVTRLILGRELNERLIYINYQKKNSS